MHKKFKNRLILAVVFSGFYFCAIADPPGPPPPGGNPGTGGGIPVGAPIDSGVIILLILGIGYGVWKFYSAWRKTDPAKVKSL